MISITSLLANGQISPNALKIHNITGNTSVSANIDTIMMVINSTGDFEFTLNNPVREMQDVLVHNNSAYSVTLRLGNTGKLVMTPDKVVRVIPTVSSGSFTWFAVDATKLEFTDYIPLPPFTALYEQFTGIEQTITTTQVWSDDVALTIPADLTFEYMWKPLNTAPSTIYILGEMFGEPNYQALMMYENSGIKPYFSGPTQRGFYAHPLTGGWIHYAMVRESGIVSVYVDGEPRITFANTDTMNITAVKLNRFAVYGNFVISDLGIYDGPKYTSSFTPAYPA